ncbi:hypothetical protein D3C79_395480 [compost metagenome]
MMPLLLTVISDREPQNWTLPPSFIFSSGSLGGGHRLQRQPEPVLARLRQSLFIPVAELCHDLGRLAATSEQAYPLQQLPLGTERIGRQGGILDAALGEASLPGRGAAFRLAGQGAPGGLQRLICLRQDGTRLQLVSDDPQPVAISLLPVTGPGPAGQAVQQGVHQRGGLQPACLGRLRHPHRAGQQIMLTTRQGGEGGEGIGAQPEVAARRQQQLMGAESQQRRTSGDAQQLTQGGAFAGADLQARSRKMLIFDGVMHQFRILLNC